MDDPRTYDLSEFAVEYTWAMMFWNSAEQTLRQIVAELIGGSSAPSLAVAMDMGNRDALHALTTARRAMEDVEFQSHLEHLTNGFSLMMGYRNLYVHSLMAVAFDPSTKDQNVKLHGQVIRLKGEGRLRATNQIVTTAEMGEFKAHCLALSLYARAIMNELNDGEWDLSGLLDMPPPSLEKPIWPASPQWPPDYLQE